MKKIILSAVAVFAFGFMNAQEVTFGAKAGLNIANLSGDIDDTKSLLGAHVGVFAEIQLTEQFAFAPELLYSMQGAKTEFSQDFFGESMSVETTTRLGYLNIPLMFKFYATDAFYVEAGPQVGLLLSAKGDYEGSFGGITESEKGVDMKDDFKTIDFGLNFGLGYNFTENIFVGARYNLGLSNIADADGEEEGDFKIKNSVISVSVGYRF